ncbi:amino acid transporter [Glycomyces sp. NPDC047010]|uniref:nucleotidyltransferase domain-containing protein n=1 Tax=Glycomyces sp. NPDC047010 TaxID=3155023 RepID=UPI0033F9C3F7
MTAPFADPAGAWDPPSLHEIQALLAGLDAPWWIAGGWAIELAVGRPVRPHNDVDVLMLHRDHPAIQAVLPDWEWWAADPPGTLRPWRPGEILPHHIHDIWCRPTADHPWSFQFMLDNADGDHWVSRRDPRIRRPIPDIGRTTHDGLPYLAPEIQLFYKSKGPRPKDELDFKAALPILTPEQRQWLDSAINLTRGPGR